MRFYSPGNSPVDLFRGSSWSHLAIAIVVRSLPDHRRYRLSCRPASSSAVWLCTPSWPASPLFFCRCPFSRAQPPWPLVLFGGSYYSLCVCAPYVWRSLSERVASRGPTLLTASSVGCSSVQWCKQQRRQQQCAVCLSVVGPASSRRQCVWCVWRGMLASLLQG